MTDTEHRALRIALLIDADNAPADLIDEILTELSTLGVINIRRAYGNWTKPGLSGWQRRLLEFAIRPMQQFDYSKGKNASDMAMTVDAMELLYTERPDAYGIVSSDADFTPLVRFHTFNSSSIDFSVILRVKTYVDNYLLKHEFIKRLQKRYAAENISIPFPITAVNLDQEGADKILRRSA